MIDKIIIKKTLEVVFNIYIYIHKNRFWSKTDLYHPFIPILAKTNLESLLSWQTYTCSFSLPWSGFQRSIIWVALMTTSASKLAVFIHTPVKLSGNLQRGGTFSALTVKRPFCYYVRVNWKTFLKYHLELGIRNPCITIK